jgi:plastocyanin
MAKKLKPGQKRCPSCGAAVSGPRTKACPKCGHQFNGKPQKVAKNGGTVTLDKSQVNKTQAVRDYLKDHPGAMNVEIAAALTKQGITIMPAHVSAIKTKGNKAHTAKKAAKKPAVVEVAAPAPVEKPTKNGDTITLEQVKKVAHTVKTIGGYQRMIEVLDVIKASGGVKKFKDLAEAMTATGTDDIPF